MSRSFTIVPVGAFSLRESAQFGFGQRAARTGEWDGVMRMAFCLDGGFEQQVAVEVCQDDAGVHVTAHGAGDLDAIRAQTARVLSLDRDSGGFAEVGRRDPVIRRLQLAAPGLRPPLFHSPYEAAAWSVLSARRPGWQMAQVRAALSRAVGRPFDSPAGAEAAFPTPRRLLRLAAFPGIDAERLDRLHGVARAAADGVLEAQRLGDLGPDDALADIQRIKGIGAFYGSLIVVRSVGFTDALPVDEPRVRGIARELYGADELMSPTEFAEFAAVWAPWRTWAAVLVRAVGPRVLATPSGNLRERLSA